MLRLKPRWHFRNHCTVIVPAKLCTVQMKLNVPALSNSRQAVAPKPTFKPGSLARIGLGATLCDGDMTNLTMPPTLIPVDGGMYDVSLVSLVVTVGTVPGRHATVRTVGGPASTWTAASGDWVLPPPPQATSGSRRASGVRRCMSAPGSELHDTPGADASRSG